jgi:hypothetical protein
MAAVGSDADPVCFGFRQDRHPIPQGGRFLPSRQKFSHPPLVIAARRITMQIVPSVLQTSR